jgi:hypothetical protein
MSHSPDPHSTKVDATKAIDDQKWVKYRIPAAIFISFCTLYFTKDTPKHHKPNSIQVYQNEESSPDIIVVSQLLFNSQGYSIKEISRKTQVRFDVPGYQFDISGTAKLDDVCTIKNGDVIEGTLPPEKEYYMVTPLDRIISLTFKKQ